MAGSINKSVDLFSMENVKIWTQMSDDDWLDHIKGRPTLCDVLHCYGSENEEDPQTEDGHSEDAEPEYIRERRLKKIIEKNRQNIVKLVPPPIPQRTPRKQKYNFKVKQHAQNFKKMNKPESTIKDNLTIAIAEEEKIKHDKFIIEKKKKQLEDTKYLYNFNCAVEMMKLACINKSNKSINSNKNTLIIENKEALDKYLHAPIIKTNTLKSIKKTVRFEDGNKENTKCNIRKHKGKWSSKDFRSEAEKIEYEKYVSEHTENKMVKHELVIDSSPEIKSWEKAVQKVDPYQREEYIIETEPEIQNSQGTKVPVLGEKRKVKTSTNLKHEIESVLIKNEGIPNYEQELLKYKEKKQKLSSKILNNEENITAKNIVKTIDLKQGFQSVWIKEENSNVLLGKENKIKTPILKEKNNLKDIEIKQEQNNPGTSNENYEKLPSQEKSKISEMEYKFYETSDEDEEILPITKRKKLVIESSDSEHSKQSSGSEEEYFRVIRKRKIMVESSESSQEQVEFKQVRLNESNSNIIPQLSELNKVEPSSYSDSDANMKELRKVEIKREPLRDSDSDTTLQSELSKKEPSSDSDSDANMKELSKVEIKQTSSDSDSDILTESSKVDSEQESSSDSGTLTDSTDCELSKVEIKQDPLSECEMDYEHFTVENVAEWIKLEPEE